MVKWLSSLFDTTDKEITRLRRIVGQANDEIVALLETQRESVGALRESVFGELDASGVSWQPLLAGEITSVTGEARRLTEGVSTLRTVIEKGEETSRVLSVLPADAKQLSAMNAEKLQ